VAGKVLGGGSGTITGVGAWALGSAGAALATAATFTGITALANWLRAIIRSDAADATALSEINATGGTYDETTDSLQGIATTQVEELAAIAEAQGVLDKVDTTLELSGSAYRFTTEALAQAPTGDAPTAEEIADAVDTELSNDFEVIGEGLNAIAANTSIAATTAAKLDTALEADGTNYRYTEGALALAPTGSGGSGVITSVTASGYTLSANEVDLEIYRGDDVDIVFTIYQDTAQTTEYDLTDCELTFTVKKREDLYDADDADSVIQETMTLDADPTTGKATLSLTAEDTENMELDLEHEWDICIETASGDLRTGARGTLVVRPNVTRTPRIS
jgi:hypothetical protein